MEFPVDIYEVDLFLDLEDTILDSITTIDFILDSIIVVASNDDPSQDNHPLGGEGDSLFNISEDSTELFVDLGFDWCPDLYEAGIDNSCLCDFLNNPDECDTLTYFLYNEDR